MSDALAIMLTGALVASACAILGTFLMLRKMSMIGDAISHAVLPGIVIAYLVSHSRASLPMMIGAAIVGLLTTGLIELINRKGRLQADAAIGLSFTLMFAIGVILISLFAGNIDLDQECVLYGDILYVPLDTLSLGGLPVLPRSVWILSGLMALIGVYIWLGYKGLLITSFDPAMAASLGISTAFWHYSLMGMVSLTTVLSFEFVGAILVVAFLIVPPAIAYLLTDHLPSLMGYAILAGVISAIGGYYLATAIDGSVAGAMATVLGLEFAGVFVFSRKTHVLSHRKKHPIQGDNMPTF